MTEVAVGPEQGSRARARWGERLSGMAVLLGMLAVLAVLAVARPLFLSLGNLNNIAVDATVLVVLAVGLTLVMSMRGIDLSIVAVADLSGYIVASMVLAGIPFVTALLAGMAAALVVGLVNGLLSAYLGVPAIAASLGTNLLVTASALVISDNGTPQQLFTAPLELVRPILVFGSDSWGPFRLLILATACVLALAWFVSRRTIWGRRADLVSANARASELSAIPTRRTFALGFVFSAALAGIGGIMLTARTGLAVPGSADPLLLEAFSAVYLGSIASPGGRIRVLWTVVGALFVTMLANGLILLGLGAEWRYALNGLLILLALGLRVLRRRR